MGKLAWRDLVMLAACVACPILAVGFSSTFPLWIGRWMTDFGVTRSTVMLAFIGQGVMATVLMPVVGRLLAHFSPRAVIIAGAVTMGVGLLLMAVTNAFWQVGALLALSSGVGGIFVGSIPPVALAIRRLPAHVGKIAGLMTLGFAIGGVIMPLVVAPLLVAAGWRMTSAIAGAVVMTVIPLLVWFFTQDTPVLEADAVNAAPPVDDGKPILTTRQILSTLGFWLIPLGSFPVMAFEGGFRTNIVPLLADIGVGLKAAGYVLSAMAAGSAIGAVVGGWLGDRVDPRKAFAGITAVYTLAVVSLAGAHHAVLAFVSLTVMGAASGAMQPLPTLLIVRRFGARGFAPVAGLLGPVMIPTAAAPALVAWMRDQSGGYAVALLASAPLILAGALAIWATGKSSASAEPLAAAQPS